MIVEINPTKLHYGAKIKMTCFPLHEFCGIKYTTSLDEEQSEEECLIEKYWDDDVISVDRNVYPHKVKVVPLNEKFSTESYYWGDFITMIRKGTIKQT